MARVAPPAAPVAEREAPSLPSASALELRRSPVAPSARTAAPAVARPVRPTPSSVSAGSPRSVDPQPDMEPHSWEAASFDEDREEWTRVTTKRPVPMAPVPATIHPAAGGLSTADAALADLWRPPTPSVTPAALASADGSNDTRRVPTRSDRRPLSTTAPVEARHSWATPQFAPARDEDQDQRRPLRARVDHPTPLPTPWRSEALQDPAEGFAAQRFPALPDEPPDGIAPEVAQPGSRTRSSLPVSASSSQRPQSPIFSASERGRPDSSDLVNAWPTLPAARVRPLRTSSVSSLGALPTADRWPDLLADEAGEGDDPDLSLPSGHRERLEREQRGLAWNG